MQHIRKLFLLLGCFCLLSLLVESKTSLANAACPWHLRPINVSIGVVINESSRVGREQRIAMELAADDFRHCLNLVLHFRDSNGSSAHAAHAAVDLINEIHVDVVLGTITLEEALLVSEFKTMTRSTPIISLSPMASAPKDVTQKLLPFIQMSTSITHQTQCISAIVGKFKWRKVILIHEQGTNSLEDFRLITHLSDSLQAIDSSIEHQLAVPHISSLLDPRAFLEKELKKVRRHNVKIFVVAQSSLEFSVALFETAKKLGMMEEGYVWIISDDIANLLDSVNFSVLRNMQGVVGLKANYADTTNHFNEFKSKFWRGYQSKYLIEENPNPSMYSLHAYDAIWTIAKALRNSRRKYNSTELANHILSSDFEGLSGKIRFKEGLLVHKSIFWIVNVIGKSYTEVAVWSPDFGFSKDLVELDGKMARLNSDQTAELSSIFWPGRKQSVPKGWTVGYKEKPLRIGVPAKCLFNRFVNITYDTIKNKTLVTGFSVEVFKAAIEHLPYDVHYEFVPHVGSYDEMVAKVHNKSLDAAVGDTVITANRYLYAEFSQPYIESGIAMVVTVKPVLPGSKFIFLNAFTKKMWFQLVGMSMCTGTIIWLNEYSIGNEQFTRTSFLGLIGSILWLSVTILSFSHREHIKNYASKIVLAAWICVVFVVGASFTAVLSSMMTVPRLQPSILDIDYLRRTNAVVGCDWYAFVCEYLVNVLDFKKENVRRFYSIEDYPKAFENGEIKAAFFSTAHARVFVSMYCKSYTISGTNYKIGGLGFAFQKGSPLAIDISEAILKLTQSGELNNLEKNTLSFTNCSSSTQRADEIRLDEKPFSGLFLVLGVIIGLTSFISIVRLVKKHSTKIYDSVKIELIRHQVGMWASMILSKCRARFGSRAPNVAQGTVEPNLVEIQTVV